MPYTAGPAFVSLRGMGCRAASSAGSAAVNAAHLRLGETSTSDLVWLAGQLAKLRRGDLTEVDAVWPGRDGR